jgi:hypothetical protein
MAQALGWDRVASFYIDLEALVPPSGIPKPGPLQMHLPDDHVRYAIIWFSLAGLLLIAFAVSLRGRMPALPDVGVLAPLRHAEPCDECRLSGLKRKKRGHRQTVAIDPSATLAGSKFRSAAVSYATVVCAIFDTGSTWASSASVDSEQFRSIPRTCWSLCRRFSVRQTDQRRQGERNARCLA